MRAALDYGDALGTIAALFRFLDELSDPDTTAEESAAIRCSIEGLRLVWGPEITRCQFMPGRSEPD